VLTNFRSPWDPEAGGGQTATDDLARALKALGLRVRAVYAGSPGDVLPEYPVHWVAFSARPMALALNVARGVRRLLKEEPADLVHSTGFEGAWIVSSIPRIATLHQPDLPPWQPPTWTRPLERLRYLRRNLRFALERQSLKRASRVVFTSSQSRDLASAGGYPVKASRVVHNGVDTRTFAPRARPDGGPPIVLFVGRFDAQKGVDILFHAWRDLDARAQLRLAATGWKELEYRELARDLALSSVVFQGHVPRAQLPELLQQASVLVLPSRYENFPLSLLEAMACGVPVVATRVGGIPELVEDGQTGLLVPPEDPEALGEAIRRILDDPGLASGLARAARAVVESRFTWESVGRQIISMYEEVLVGAGVRSSQRASPVP